MAAAEPTLPIYRLALAGCAPIVRHWARLEVSGLDCVPACGPVLLAGNHDSHWDPIVVGVAAFGHRQIRALAKASLWRTAVSGAILDGMGQIPIVRGAADADALERAIAELRAGRCVGIFPEATISRGQRLRARSGVGRLALAVPEAAVIGCAIRGSAGIAKLPRRPRASVHFFEVTTPAPTSVDEVTAFATGVLAEIRRHARPVPAGRTRVRDRAARGA